MKEVHVEDFQSCRALSGNASKAFVEVTIEFDYKDFVNRMS